MNPTTPHTLSADRLGAPVIEHPDAVAVIGMAGRFPQSPDVETFWRHLAQGTELIQRFDADELRAAGFSEEQVARPGFIGAASVLEDADAFDADFFKVSAAEAELMDPQHRVFLECCWHAMENAGYAPGESAAGEVGVYAGSGISTYMLAAAPRLTGGGLTSLLQLLVGNDKDYLATRVSYKLRLTGPSVCVQSACSTSLLAVHMAAQSVLAGECTMALAGGADISVPQKMGYEYQPGMIFSPDGRCRAFDAQAGGTVAGNGAGVVVLKRLDLALRDGDTVLAVLRGSSVNNDGADKIGYTAPSVAGQARVIAQALAAADVSPDSIGYVEAHGTGTELGDPIEVHALERAFRSETRRVGFCALGSVKTNIGHLNAAAGIASFIKTVLALRHRAIPPSLHYTQPNPKIDFERSPFFVNTELRTWDAGPTPRRAGVSSFGFGGTNVHVILEEAPAIAKVDALAYPALLVLSARSEVQLRALADAYALALGAENPPSLRDACHTAMKGRLHDGAHRLALVSGRREDMVAGLRAHAQRIDLGECTIHGIAPTAQPVVAALFTGQGAQHAGMASDLYTTHGVFRKAIDDCELALDGVLQQPLSQVLFGPHTALLERTDHAQPAMFAVEYALYQVWTAAGVRFRAVAGHSLGEFVAACVAGVMGLTDALKLVAERGRLIQSIEGEPGRMLAVLTQESVVRAALRGFERSLSIAAVNGPRNVVVAGDAAAVVRFQSAMESQGVSTRMLLIADAFHSPRMDSVLDAFERTVAGVPLKAPRIPVVSNLYGRVVADEEITTPRYWRDHLRQPVLFEAGMRCLVQDLGVDVLLECGPHPVLSRLAADCLGLDANVACIASLKKGYDDTTQFLLAAGQLYTRGVIFEWEGLTGGVAARRVPLPGYPFSRQRYWLAAVDKGLHGHAEEPTISSSAWSALLLAGRIQADAGLAALDLGALCAHEALLLEHARASVLQAFERLGLFTYDGRPHTMTVLAQRGGVQPRFHQLLERLLRALVEAGRLKIDTRGVYSGFAPPEAAHVQMLAAQCDPVWVTTPHFKPVFLQAADQLAAVLAGRTTGLEAMLGDGSLASAEGIYADLPTSRYFNALVSAVVRAWADSAGGRPLRVLEIGAGTGATTQQVLSHLSAGCTEYVFSDVSPLFLDRAAARFSEHPFMRYQLFDIDAAPAPQGLELRSFDLILASNVLHAAADLRTTMENVRDLLRPSGVLVMYEIVRETLIGEITTGLLLPMVRDADLRGIQPFMDEMQWHGLLAGLGFDAQVSFPEADCEASVLGERVLVARRAEATGAGARLQKPMRSDAPVYRRVWKLSEYSAPTKQRQPDHWFIVSDASGVGKALADVLHAHGHEVERIAHGEAYALEPRLRNWVRRKTGLPGRVVHLCGIGVALDAQTSGAELRVYQHETLGELLRLLGAMGEADVQALGQLCIVTRGAQTVASHEAPALAQTPLWGFSQVAALGHPELNMKLVDLDPLSSPRESAGQLAVVLLQEDGETERALRGGRCFVPRLHRQTVPEALAEGPVCDPSAGYLIAGGLGGLGLETARWLAKNGARHLVLAGRSVPGAAAAETIAALHAQGVDVQAVQIDLRDEVALCRAVTALPWPLKGVVHCAVVTDAVQLGDLPPLERALEVMAPKVEGAWNLHRATESVPLDFFILYSSSVSLVPARGLPDYVAGNAFLDALACYRQARGLPALSVSWGAWSDVGTVATRDQLQRLERGGLRSFSPARALDLLAVAMASGEAHLGVFDVDWPVLLRGHPAEQIAHYFHPVAAKTVAGRSESEAVDRNDVRALLHSAPDEASREHLLRLHLQQTVGRLLRRASTDIPPDADLLHLGIDSLMFLDLTHRLGQALGLQIRPNELMAEMNVAAMARKLATMTGGNTAIAPDAPESLLQSCPSDAALPFELTDVQQAYWIGRHHDMALGSVACHGYMELDCDDLDHGRLTAAWRELVVRHEMLRCVIEVDGMQRILAQVPTYEIADMDLRSETADARQERLSAVRAEMSHRVPRTDLWPLFDIRTSRLDARRTRLHISLDNIMTDGRSIGILLSEWVALYTRPTHPLPLLGLGFRDYAQAVQRYRQGQEYASAREYWLQRLESMPPAPSLPLAKDPTQVRSPRFHRREFNLPSEAWHRLRRRGAERAGLTPSGLLLAVYAEVLGRWSSAQRFTINVPTFNRLPVHPQVNDIVGEFTSLILLAVDGGDSQPFEVRARRLQEQLLRDQAHDSFTGVQVMREIARREGAQRAAMPVVFTSTFGLAEQADLGHAEREEQATGLGKLVYTISQTPQVWIDNHVHDHGGRLNVCWDSVDELFPEGLLDAMFSAYCALLRDLADSGDAVWSLLVPITLPADQQARRDDYNATIDTTLLLEPMDLLAPFLRSVATQPHRLALIAGEDRFSYRALHDAAQWIGWQLRESGLQPCERVAIVMPKGWKQVASVVGAMAAGAAYVPIDPQWPEHRRHELLAACGIRRAIVGFNDAPLKWPRDVEVLAVPDARELCEIGAQVRGFEWHVAQGGDVAYIIFTSGSTGKPKGVVIDHRGALNTVLDVNRRFGICPSDTVFGLSALSFDLSVQDIFGTFAAGACLVLPEVDGLRDAQHWLELVVHHNVTVWNSVPALCQMLVEQAGTRVEALQSLRCVMLSGDWIPLSLPDALQAIAPQARLIGLGGATEASIWSIYHRVDGVLPDWRSIPYGRPLANQSFHVLNAALQPCPEWVVGDLYIGGIGLAMGYWADEARTDAAFVRHPVSGDRLYRTGDLGRFHPQGHIEFLGRQDHQVKVNGYRIELGEIESALRTNDAVEEALVIAIGADGGRSRAGTAEQRKQSLVAYVVPVDGTLTTRIEREVLRDFLCACIPEYMVPSEFIVLDRLPLSANGKVDRAALPVVASVPLPRESLPPVTPVERALAAEWCDLLSLASVNRCDHFFELGGDSLLATRLCVRLKERQGIALSVRQVFAHPELQAMADCVVTPFAGPRELVLCLSPAPASPVERYWFGFHGSDGDVFAFRPMAQALRQVDAGVALYGLQSPLDPPLTMEAMAHGYVHALRQVQPRGPYRLCGFSSGGVLAWEAARQLRDVGETVERLLLIDTVMLPDVLLAKPLGTLALFAASLGVPQDALPWLNSMNPVPDAGDSSDRFASWVASLPVVDDHALHAAIDALPAGGSWAQGDLRDRFALFRHHVEAVARYVPRSLSGVPVRYLHAAASAHAAVPWRAHCEQLILASIPGDHFSCMQTAQVAQWRHHLVVDQVIEEVLQ